MWNARISVEQILTVNCLSVYTVEKNSLFFLLTALEKVSFVWPYFQGMWYVLALFDLCILSYLHIYNDGGHVKGIFVHLLSDFMITTKLEFSCLWLSVIQNL